MVKLWCMCFIHDVESVFNRIILQTSWKSSLGTENSNASFVLFQCLILFNIWNYSHKIIKVKRGYQTPSITTNTRWRHDMEMLFALFALSEGNLPVTVDPFHKGPVMSSGDDLFYVSLKKYFNKQLRFRRFETQWRPYEANVMVIFELAWDLLISHLSLEVCWSMYQLCSGTSGYAVFFSVFII